MMGYMKRVMEQDHDFYDVVGARVHAEIAGWYRKRLKDPYHLLGLIDGEWVGFANGRLMNEDINISSTRWPWLEAAASAPSCITSRRITPLRSWGTRNSATYESYNGWHRWGLGMAQPSYRWPEYQHELGGAWVYYVTKKYWDAVVKDYVRQMVGADLNFDVPVEIVKANEHLQIPRDVTV